MLVLGIACLLFFFLPVSLMEHYKNIDGRKNRWLHIVTFITSFIVFLGALFKIMHWPYAGVIMVFSIPIPFILFLPVFLYTSNRNKAPISDNISILFLLLFYAVFSSLLSLSISKNILDEGVLSSREWTNVEYVYNHEIQQTKANAVEVNNSNLKDIQNIQSSGDKLCDEISELIYYVAVSASQENKTAIDKEGNIHFEYLNRIDAMITGVDLFRNEGKGVEMLNHLNAYKKLLLNTEGLKTSPVKDLAQEMLDTSPNGEVLWDESHVLNLPLAWEISSLQSIKASVRICESEAINYLTRNVK